MENYIITVNGVEYDVTVEKKSAGGQAPKVAPVEAPAPKKVATEGTNLTVGTAGKVWKIVTKAGDTIKKGDNVMILEAMKMEIPVVATMDGTIKEILVSEGDSVASGQAVAVIG